MTRSIAFVLYPDFQMPDAAGSATGFRIAGRVLEQG